LSDEASTALSSRTGHEALNVDYDSAIVEYVNDFVGKHCLYQAGKHRVVGLGIDVLGVVRSIALFVGFRRWS